MMVYLIYGMMLVLPVKLFMIGCSINNRLASFCENNTVAKDAKDTNSVGNNLPSTATITTTPQMNDCDELKEDVTEDNLLKKGLNCAKIINEPVGGEFLLRNDPGNELTSPNVTTLNGFNTYRKQLSVNVNVNICSKQSKC